VIAETTATLSTFLQDLIIPLQENFPKKHVLSDELTRKTQRTNFHGLQVRVPFLLNPKQGTGSLSQTGTLNAAKTLDDNAAFIAMGRVAHPIELSMDLIQAVDAKDFVYAGDALKLHMAQAENSIGRVENEFFCGAGDALVAAITSDTTNSTTVYVGTTANFYQTYINRIVDVVNRASGTSIYSAISITAVGASSITVNSAVTVVSTQGLYIEGSYGNAIQGLRQPDATTGTFQGVNLANVPGFRVVDGRGGSASAVDLSMAIMDGAYRRVNQASGRSPDFWVGDPAAVDKFGQGLTSQFRWNAKVVQLSTGWQGIDYRGTPVIPEFDMPFGYVLGVTKDAVSVYGYTQGPDWDDQTGSRFQRFSRSLPVEAWLVDYVQLGIHAPNMLVKIANLNQAS
jgi:hypothetical protein